MPSWDEPNWDDVRWDHAAAEAAISALRRAADAVDQAAVERARQSREAVAEWRGSLRGEFDERLRHLMGEAASLVAACRSAAEEVGRANQRAREEQARREREREEWERNQRRNSSA